MLRFSLSIALIYVLCKPANSVKASCDKPLRVRYFLILKAKTRRMFTGNPLFSLNSISVEYNKSTYNESHSCFFSSDVINTKFSATLLQIFMTVNCTFNFKRPPKTSFSPLITYLSSPPFFSAPRQTAHAV